MNIRGLLTTPAAVKRLENAGITCGTQPGTGKRYVDVRIGDIMPPILLQRRNIRHWAIVNSFTHAPYNSGLARHGVGFMVLAVGKDDDSQAVVSLASLTVTGSSPAKVIELFTCLAAYDRQEALANCNDKNLIADRAPKVQLVKTTTPHTWEVSYVSWEGVPDSA